ncbi:Nucleoside-diphosphate-sugar epimerase [Catalinimonas alkaloidigena]|uniref:Nucleoside-diphosphate-sugar epimerase n=1 Tax=Catalinimonas alkaloidigena TaxID=1075417 RepID=A0A1G9HV32_9BACT|nr:NAD-dependent epimerase/dehydratase family protein [Catalinimonas alkaloidigena]SDL16830.1 Nucleoside-diphosphate-sugar epimerase [Catalinimonas alkaloidigena]
MHTILGAGGTIAVPLAKELSRYTDKIRLVSRNPQKINPTDELFPADLSKPGAVASAVEGSDVVYLLVGFDYNIDVWREKWPRLMRSVIDACEEYDAKLVFFDNVYMYDRDSLGRMTEETPHRPTSKKGEVRARLHKMIFDAVEAGALTAMIVRAADFYGPQNDKSVLVETVYKGLLQRKRATWFGPLDKKHTFTYTPDAAKATALLATTPDAYNQVWHVPTSREALTGKQWVDLFAKEMGLRPKVLALPVWLIGVMGWFVPFMREMHEMMYQYDRDYIFDSSKFEQRFHSTPTSPAEGVKQTVHASAE